MLCGRLRRPAWSETSPKILRERGHEQRFRRGDEGCADHVARPMGAEVNARPANRGGEQKIEPAPAAKEKRADRADDHVIGHMAGRKRWTGLVPIRFVRISDRRLFEEGEKARMCRR